MKKILLLLSNTLYPAEIILKSGDAFICDMVEENESTLTIQTILGYLHLDKTKIAEVQKPDPSIDVSIPKDYFVTRKTKHTLKAYKD